MTHHPSLDLTRRADPSKLPERMDDPCSRDALRACLRDLARVNRWFLGYRPVLHWLESVAGAAPTAPLRILDVGCGYGDGLRRVERWARQRGIPVELTGIDLNPDTIGIAAQATPPQSAIRWVSANIFDYQNAGQTDVVVSSLFTHHLRDDEVVRFLEWMERNARIAWFINDLERASIPFHLFRWFSKAAGLHPFVQHDGPVSFRRAFVPEDWRRICAAATLAARQVEVLRYWPARLCVSRRKSG